MQRIIKNVIKNIIIVFYLPFTKMILKMMKPKTLYFQSIKWKLNVNVRSILFPSLDKVLERGMVGTVDQKAIDQNYWKYVLFTFR
jgi:hypothetical protein